MEATGIPMPGHERRTEARREMAVTNGTLTRAGCVEYDGTFISFAYAVDPKRAIQQTIPLQDWLTLGIDKGGSCVKIGVTYNNAADKMVFMPLLVYEGKDDWHGLSLFGPAQNGITVLEDDSADCPNFMAVLQWILDARGAFFSSDWMATNAVLGLGAPSSTYGCFHCTGLVRSLEQGAPRTLQQLQDDLNTLFHPDNEDAPRDASINHSVVEMPLLSIRLERLVGCPLHLVLGFVNCFIGEVLPSIVGDKAIAPFVERARSLRQVGCGGAQQYHELTGPELERFVDRESFEDIASEQDDLAARTRVRFVGGARDAEASRSMIIASPGHRIRMLGRWSRMLKQLLLCKSELSDSKLNALDVLYQEMKAEWVSITQRPPIFKLHLFGHMVQFARRNRVTGSVSESRMESCHGQYNYEYAHHRNKAREPAERHRRTLAIMLEDHVRTKY